MISTKYLYEIHTIQYKELKAQLQNLYQNCVSNNEKIVRLTFFGNPSDNEEYIKHSNSLHEDVKNLFGLQMPAISYIAQKPIDESGSLIIEICKLNNDFNGTVLYKEFENISYLEIIDNEDRELIISGIQSKYLDLGIGVQATEIFHTLENILRKEDYPIHSIVRQWNYIERITDFADNQQHYQLFNDARSIFYTKTQWPEGYPAATGIGTQWGGIVIDLNAVKSSEKEYRCIPLDNNLQVAAYDYSQKVLLGKKDENLKERTTPKFERAKALADKSGGIIYISGTAAIRGEESLLNVGIEEQTKITIENILHLISKDNLLKEDISISGECSLQILRVYLKNEEDITLAKNYINKVLPEIPISYLLANVCREELLIEIEGIASFSL